MRRACSRWAVAILVAGLASTPLASADSGMDKLLSLLRDALERSDVQAVLTLLDASRTEVIAADAEAAFLACGYAAVYARRAVDHAKHPDQVPTMIERFLALADRAVAMHGESADAHRALGAARMARCRQRLATGDPVTAADWRAAAEACRAASRLTPDPMPAVAAARYLAEGAASTPVDRGALLAEAEQVCRQALAGRAGEPHLSVALAEVRYAQARMHLGAGKKAEAKVAALEALELLREPSRRTDDVWRDACAVHNRAVNLLKRSGLDRKAAFLTAPQPSRWGYLSVDVPKGAHWTREPAKPGDDQRLLTLVRDSEAPDWGQTRISFWCYRWDTNYTTPEGKMGGDNLRGLLEQDRAEWKALLSKVRRQKPLVRGPLNEWIRETTGLELYGTDAEGDAWYARCLYFKSEHGPRSYGVEVSSFGTDPGPDPEIEHVLDSVRELAPAAK